MLSRLAPEKRIADGIEVFARVYKARPGGVLWIVGSGPEEERLRARVDALGISHTVIFFGWQEHPSAFYKSSDVLLCTSAFEGYGLTFIEAALCGCPVVSTPVGVAASSLFIHKKNSEIVSRVGDIQGLYEGVLTVLDGAGESYASSLKEDVRLTLLSQKEYTTQYVTLLQSLRYDPKT
jgi:glycosyltransferase involved in cell wall biosynthesis